MMAHARTDALGGIRMHMAPDVKVWTVDDLADLPDDGQRYEVIDGELFVTPAPALRHQEAIQEFLKLLHPYLAANPVGRLMTSPADIRFSKHRGVQPDLFVAPFINGARPRQWTDIRHLVLAVEVLSPSSIRADRVVKRAMYRDQGVADYWVVDLDARAFERTTPATSSVEVVTDFVQWHPIGVSEPLTIDVAAFFAEVLDG
jgi:Uma2 family endonuclease